MTIRARLSRLEARIGDPADRCSACGFPRAIDYLVVRHEDQLLKKCKRCGRTLCPDGKPLASPCKVIVLADGYEDD